MPSPSMPSGTTWMDGAALLELTKISSVQPNVVMFGGFDQCLWEGGVAGVVRRVMVGISGWEKVGKRLLLLKMK